jgi:hypothetical protein
LLIMDNLAAPYTHKVFQFMHVEFHFCTQRSRDATVDTSKSSWTFVVLIEHTGSGI